MSSLSSEQLMRRTIQLAQKSMEANKGGPFGATIVKEGAIIAEGTNLVTSENDPTAHAEIVAIRKAARTLDTFDLSGCTLFASCEPCPMCLGAVYWAHLDQLYFAATKQDAASIDFDDHFIYQEMEVPIEDRQLPTQQILREEAVKVFELWDAKEDKIKY